VAEEMKLNENFGFHALLESIKYISRFLRHPFGGKSVTT
jgi:hypothetical protein